MPHANSKPSKTARKPKAEEKPAKAQVKAKAPVKERASAKAADKSAKLPTPEPAARRPKTDLAAKVLHLISEEMAIEEAELTSNASFKEDLNLDEIDIAELLMQAERSFNVTPFDEEDWEACETVGDFVKLVEAHSTGGKGRSAKRA